MHRRLQREDGLTLVEVLVTCLMVGLIGFTFVGLDAANRTTADQRQRAKAFTVAQADQERIKGLSADQIAILNQSRTVTSDATPYTVTSVGKFISSSSASDSCSSAGAAADYAKVTSTVTWAGNARGPIVIQAIITPRAGGSVVGQTVDQTGAPLAGSSIVVRGNDQNTASIRRTGSTDVAGCTIFGALLVGDYNLTASRSGYIDKDGDSAPVSAITATSGNTSTAIFSLGLPGRLRVNFTASISGTTVGATSPSLTYANNQMATPGIVSQATSATSLTTPSTLFPFTTGSGSPASYTGNYSVYAGSCTADAPPTPGSATVAPGDTAATTTLQLPALKLIVNYKTKKTNVRTVPDNILITDGCGQTWREAVSGSAATSSNGALANPGEPYGPLTVCVDDQGYTARGAVTNNNFTTGASLTLTVDSTVSSNQGTC